MLILKINDHIKISKRNRNHTGNSVCAYAGMEGYVIETNNIDGSFTIWCENSYLIVPMSYYGKPLGKWLYINGKLSFYTHPKIL